MLLKRCTSGDASSEAVVRYNLPLHHNVLAVTAEDLVEIKIVRAAHVDKPLPRNDIMLNAASHMILASYRNQLSHVFVRIAMVSLSVNGCTSQETLSMSMSDVFFKHTTFRMTLRSVYVRFAIYIELPEILFIYLFFQIQFRTAEVPENLLSQLW